MAALVFSLAVIAMAVTSSLTPVAGKGGFSIDLIHRDSLKSPLRDPAATRFDRARAAARRSAHKANIIAVRASGDGSIVSKVTPDVAEYLMELHLGTPAFKTIAIADTGSDLIWTNCKPCTQCFKQKPPLFDPRTSSTYKNLGCNTQACSSLPAQGCGSNSVCEYHYAYGDQSNVDGVLSTETFTFDTTSGGKVAVPKIAFGCNSQSSGTFSSETGGLVGLGAGTVSLVTQLGDSIDNKFAYCLVPLSSTQASSQLSFGAAAEFQGTKLTTPLIIDQTFYYLSLSDISVMGHRIPVVGGSSGSGNIIIDSGTTLTILYQSVLSDLVSTLSGLIDLPKVADPDGLFSLCYDVSGASGSSALPDITFNFEGAAVKLSPLNMFLEVAQDVVCLAAVATSSLDFQIYGNVAQQNFHVGYDLSAGELSFAPTDCTKQ